MRQRHFMVAAAMVALLIAGAALAQSKQDKEREEIKTPLAGGGPRAVHQSPGFEGASTTRLRATQCSRPPRPGSS